MKLRIFILAYRVTPVLRLTVGVIARQGSTDLTSVCARLERLGLLGPTVVAPL